jgi:hypothetical protein
MLLECNSGCTTESMMIDLERTPDNGYKEQKISFHNN